MHIPQRPLPMMTTSASSGKGSSFPMFTKGSSLVERCHTDRTPRGTGKGFALSLSWDILLWGARLLEDMVSKGFEAIRRLSRSERVRLRRSSLTARYEQWYLSYQVQGGELKHSVMRLPLITELVSLRVGIRVNAVCRH